MTLLSGETRTFQYGFLAFYEMKLRPFNMAEMKAFLGGENFENMEIENAAAFARAGTLWEYEEGFPRHGEEPKPVRWFIAQFTPGMFLELFDKAFRSAGLIKDGPAETEAQQADPLAA